MTIFYTDDVSNGEGIRVCFKLLKRWKGSLYKLLWIDLLVYLLLYYGLNLSYRFAMGESQKETFEKIVQHCQSAIRDIPISFLLGFFVSGIVSRWFLIFPTIPWLNQVSMTIVSHLDSKDEIMCRNIRIALARYLNLSWILLMRNLSDQAANRFSDKEEVQQLIRRPPLVWMKTRRTRLNRNVQRPWTGGGEGKPKIAPSSSTAVPTADDSTGDRQNVRYSVTSMLIPCSAEAGKFEYMHAFHAYDDQVLTNTLRAFNDDTKVKQTFGILITENEIAAFQNIASDFYRRNKTKYVPEYWIPIQWAQRLTLKALQKGYIFELKRANEILKELMRFRDKLQYVQLFSSIVIPLAYTQVVTIAVYSYFLCQIFASQFVEHKDDAPGRIDLYVPVFNIFSFIFLMGWYKVALCVVNPFGDDDEDFQINDILDYNLEVSYRTVDVPSFAFPDRLSFPLRKGDGGSHIEELDSFLECVCNEAQCNVAKTELWTKCVQQE
ncbi:hypothetical protein CRM22_005403 [Opisthorchis felineus]|uniref:Bestrophin homolog n=4 Tax=Opisthorchis felineus TaxID=147828 RepID=A0A4S2LR90_OPIFE|nr:hypothetical protein CRM22_005403 [Opisthorchis felineus]